MDRGVSKGNNNLGKKRAGGLWMMTDYEKAFLSCSCLLFSFTVNSINCFQIFTYRALQFYCKYFFLKVSSNVEAIMQIFNFWHYTIKHKEELLI